MRLPSIDPPNNRKPAAFYNFLRQTGLDELPMLFAVAAGDIDLLGATHPLVVDEQRQFLATVLGDKHLVPAFVIKFIRQEIDSKPAMITKSKVDAYTLSGQTVQRTLPLERLLANEAQWLYDANHKFFQQAVADQLPRRFFLVMTWRMASAFGILNFVEDSQDTQPDVSPERHL